MKNETPFFSPIFNLKNHKLKGFIIINNKNNNNLYEGYFINRIINDFLEDNKNKENKEKEQSNQKIQKIKIISLLKKNI